MKLSDIRTIMMTSVSHHAIASVRIQRERQEAQEAEAARKAQERAQP